jgi:hypothetical protein
MPRGTKASKERKRHIVAKGKVAGTKTKKIAAEAGCHPRHVERLSHDPATQILVAQLMRPYHDELASIVERSILAVNEALIAKTQRGKPNHEIRLRAVGRASELLHLAQGDKPADPATVGMVTWEEFVVMYRRRTEQHAG